MLASELQSVRIMHQTHCWQVLQLLRSVPWRALQFRQELCQQKQLKGLKVNVLTLMTHQPSLECFLNQVFLFGPCSSSLSAHKGQLVPFIPSVPRNPKCSSTGARIFGFTNLQSGRFVFIASTSPSSVLRLSPSWPMRHCSNRRCEQAAVPIASREKQLIAPRFPSQLTGLSPGVRPEETASERVRSPLTTLCPVLVLTRRRRGSEKSKAG